jgi:hypothetical protein
METVVRFAGGFRDGQTMTGPEADRYVFLTDNGRVGARFRELPEESMNRMRDLILPREQQERFEKVMAEALHDPQLLAMLRIASQKSVREEAISGSFRQAIEAAVQRYGYHPPVQTMADLQELKRQLAGLDVCHVYEVQRIEEGDTRVIHLLFVGEERARMVE